MPIEPLRPESIEAVSALHSSTLGGLLSRLGPTVLKQYYRGVMLSEAAIGLVARVDGEICGFLLGSVEPDRLREEIVRGNGIRIGWSVLAATIRRPALLLQLARSAFNPGQGGFDSTAPELVYLAVAPGHRGRGVARNLLAAFDERLRGLGERRYELSVEGTNSGARDFYRANEFVELTEYDEFGSRYLRLASPVLDVGGSKGARLEGESASVAQTRRRITVLGRASRYAAAGLAASLTYFLSVLALVELVGLAPVPAAAAATGVVIVTSYVVNRAWVFETNRSHASAFLRFVIASVLGISVNTLTMFVVVRLLGGSYAVGALAAMVIVPPLNFLVNYLWTFQSAPD